MSDNTSFFLFKTYKDKRDLADKATKETKPRGLHEPRAHRQKEYNEKGQTNC